MKDKNTELGHKEGNRQKILIAIFACLILLIGIILGIKLLMPVSVDNPATTSESDGVTGETTESDGQEKEESKSSDGAQKEIIIGDEEELPEDLYDVIPEFLPGNVSYEVLSRVGLDAPDEISKISGTKFKYGQWTEAGAAFGKAYKFACNMLDGTGRGECTVELKLPISTENVRGLLWYVDFSDVERDTEKKQGLSASITINGNTYRSMVNEEVEESGVGYYYQDGVWTRTKAVNACRMSIPDGFSGWLYVPLTSYSGMGELWDEETGLGLADVWTATMNLYTDGYVYTSDHFTLFDEILFVTSEEEAYIAPITMETIVSSKEYQAILPDTLPGNVGYGIEGRIGLDSEAELSSEVTGKFSNGHFSAVGAAYGAGYRFSCDMTLNNGAGNRAECALNYEETIKPEGSRGVLYYVDFTDVTPDPAKGGIGVAVTLGFKYDGKKYQARSQATDAHGYYYQDGEWIKMIPAKGYGDRMVVPNGFKGWLYVPYSSYTQNGKLYNEENYLINEDVEILYTQLYTEGYLFSSECSVLYDEILFVSSIEVPSLPWVEPEPEPPYEVYVPEDVALQAPDVLPGNKLYEIKERYDFESYNVKKLTGTFSNGQFTTSGAVSGNAYKFACDMTQKEGEGSRAEVTINFNRGLYSEGTDGVLFYVDFSEVVPDNEKSGLGVSVVLGTKYNNVTYRLRSQAENAVGYYYQDGVWKQTEPGNSYGDRMLIPDGYKGWLYVPYSSYCASDYNNGVGNPLGQAGADITYLQLYTEGYVFSAEQGILYDELLFVKEASEYGEEGYIAPVVPDEVTKELTALLPEYLPKQDTYQVMGRVGLDSRIDIDGYEGKCFDAQWTDAGAIYGNAFKFACDMTLEGSKRGETTITLKDAVALEGADGVLWYVDFSDVTVDEEKQGLGVAVTLGLRHSNGEGGTTKTNFRSQKSDSIGYYFDGTDWVQTAPAVGYADRMLIPAGFKGWLYVPFTSYTAYNSEVNAAGALYDPATGLGMEDAELIYMMLYTEGYVYTADHYTLFDEILLAKKDAGKLIFNSNVEEGAPNTTLGIENPEVLLTEEDKATLAAGTHVTISVEVKGEAAVSTEDKALLETAITEAGDQVLTAMDISLWKQYGTEAAVQITSTPALTVTIDIPETEEISAISNLKLYKLKADGSVLAVDGLYAPTVGTYTFETGDFESSVYALAYNDTDYPAVLPGTVPKGDADSFTEVKYTVADKLGLDSAKEVVVDLPLENSNITTEIGQTDAAVFGNALSITNPDTAYEGIEYNSALCRIKLTEPFSLEGVSGIMWHVSIDATLSGSNKTYYTALPLMANDAQYQAREQANRPGGKNIGYYYDEATHTWKAVTSRAGSQLALPEGVTEVWMYVPLNAYGTNTADKALIYDEVTGLGVDTSLQAVYPIMQRFDDAKEAVFVLDEIVLVTAEGTVTAGDTVYEEGLTEAPSVEITSEQILTDSVVLSETDKQALLTGLDLQVFANVSAATLTEEEITGIQALGLTAAESAQTISIQKKLTGQSAEQAELEEGVKLQLTATIPDSLKSTDEYVNRSYVLLVKTEHGYSIVADLDDNADTITFETDDTAGTTYAFAYKEQKLIDLIPATLPNDTSLSSYSKYLISQRIGLEDEEKATISGSKYDGGFTDESSIFGNALQFVTGPVVNGSNTNGEAWVTPTSALDISGADGVLFYVDMSDVVIDEGYPYGLCASVTLTGEVNGTAFSYRSYYDGPAYYYQDAEDGNGYQWIHTTAGNKNNADANGGRIMIPDDFKGWIYVPISSYAKSAKDSTNVIADSITGAAVTGTRITDMGLYTMGYEYNTETYITYDEILFVTKAGEVRMVEGSTGDAPMQTTVSLTDSIEDLTTMLVTQEDIAKLESTGKDIVLSPKVTAASLADDVAYQAYLTDNALTEGLLLDITLQKQFTDEEAVTITAINGEAMPKLELTIPEGLMATDALTHRSYKLLRLDTTGIMVLEDMDQVADTITFELADLTGTTYAVVYRETKLSEVIPATLPIDKNLNGYTDYSMISRLGLESLEEGKISGTKYWGGIKADAGIFGNALSYASGVYQGTGDTALDPATATGTLAAGECTIAPTDGIDISGATGIMWYVDMSKVEKNTSSTLRASVTLVGKTPLADGSTGTFNQRSYYSETGGGQAYCCMLDASGNYTWQAVSAPSAVNTAGRIDLPDDFKGWVYVPFTSYSTAAEKYVDFIDSNGAAVNGTKVTSMSLYTQGFVNNTEKYITYDEILFVKPTE